MNVLSGALLVVAAAMLAVGALIATAINHRTADPATFCGVIAFGVAAFGVYAMAGR
ncbi:MAG TPA: hypothetical protein VFA18_21170 [Gemmataceae bacterium]|nr:hypothetical protein [Gemmataceae bacterium]